MKDLYASLRLPEERVYVKDASFMRRLVAFLADLLLLDLVVFSVFGSLLAGSFNFATIMQNGWSLPLAAYAAAIGMALLGLAYFSLFEYLLGQTPGMMLLNIRAVNVTFWRALVRNAYLVPIFPFPVLWVVEPVYLLVRKTRLLELATGTRTIEYIPY